jgi:DNA-binding response OmpR family regulator
MDRKKILIAEHAPDEVAELRKALITAGYEVRIVTNGADALAIVESMRPDLVVAEMRLSVMDGPHLLQEIRNRSAMQSTPFILISNIKTLDERVSAMKLAIDDFLQKPLDVEETVARIDGLIRETELLASIPQRHTRGFSGNLAEMSLVDLLQTLEVGKKTGVLRLRYNGKEGMVYFNEGQVIDAMLGNLEARRALLRMFTWTEGTFQAEIRQHDRPRVLTVSNRDLISEGMTRLYRWDQLKSQLPPLQSLVSMNKQMALAQFTDEENDLLDLMSSNSPKRIIDLIEESNYDDLRVLTVFKNLYERHVVDALPLTAGSQNGNYLEKLKQRQSNGHAAADPITGVFETVLTKPSELPLQQPDRRRNQRRHQEDRRKHDRRRDSQGREKNRIYLNKSELILIREKLSH